MYKCTILIHGNDRVVSTTIETVVEIINYEIEDEKKVHVIENPDGTMCVAV